MVANLEQDPSAALMTCPTCGAEQPWSAQCRRCRCDMAELYWMWTQWSRMKQQCLVHLARGEFDAALRWARLCYRMIPGEGSLRLLAVCYVQLEDWPAAVAVARRALAQ